MLKDVVIIGGGLAGLTAAIAIARAGKEVLVIEQKSYPQHKVCGEYVSNEVVSYFESLGFDVRKIQPHTVHTFRLHGPSGQYVETQLPLGGFGLRRYTFDLELYKYAQSLGVAFMENTKVFDVTFEDDFFEVNAKHQTKCKSKVVLGSFGKRSSLDKQLKRAFIQKPTDYFGVKFYLKKDFSKELVSLYNFEGGYGGAVLVEDGTVDVAYLARTSTLKKYGGLEAFEQEVLNKNPAWKLLVDDAEYIWPKPMTISNISFLPKERIVNHVLMIGDAAGMIPPLVGNGMAMGIHASKLASENVLRFLDGQISRNEMELCYSKAWNKKFGSRLFWGRNLQHFMGKNHISELSIQTLKKFPFILPLIIKQTHGQPIV
ncbi:MAG: NAD(P)/FAD-dependent oxidoreductase [Bacteroidota bacterium]